MTLSVTAAFGWLNQRVIRLPHTIGLPIMGLAASLLLIAIDLAMPGTQLHEHLTAILRQVAFRATLLGGRLAFLLFAGAPHVDFGALRERAWLVGIMAALGVLISTGIVGIGFWAAAQALGHAVPLSLTARRAAVSLPVLALALSLPETEAKSAILAATYTVVMFTIVVQGPSLRRLVERVVRQASPQAAAPGGG